MPESTVINDTDLVHRSDNQIVGESFAIFSACLTYRYVLVRRWSAEPALRFVMCNPSTADEKKDDPTVARCRSRAVRLGYGGLVVQNIFALRSTDPQLLVTHPDPVGPANNDFLIDPGPDVGPIGATVAAWGTWGRVRDQGKVVAELLSSCGELLCLGTTNDGSPRHPLYVATGQELIAWPGHS